jgi:hypothetical protein
MLDLNTINLETLFDCVFRANHDGQYILGQLVFVYDFLILHGGRHTRQHLDPIFDYLRQLIGYTSPPTQWRELRGRHSNFMALAKDPRRLRKRYDAMITDPKTSLVALLHNTGYCLRDEYINDPTSSTSRGSTTISEADEVIQKLQRLREGLADQLRRTCLFVPKIFQAACLGLGAITNSKLLAFGRPANLGTNITMNAEVATHELERLVGRFNWFLTAEDLDIHGFNPRYYTLLFPRMTIANKTLLGYTLFRKLPSMFIKHVMSWRISTSQEISSG